MCFNVFLFGGNFAGILPTNSPVVCNITQQNNPLYVTGSAKTGLVGE